MNITVKTNTEGKEILTHIDATKLCNELKVKYAPFQPLMDIIDGICVSERVDRMVRKQAKESYTGVTPVQFKRIKKVFRERTIDYVDLNLRLVCFAPLICDTLRNQGKPCAAKDNAILFLENLYKNPSCIKKESFLKALGNITTTNYRDIISDYLYLPNKQKELCDLALRRMATQELVSKSQETSLCRSYYIEI